MEFEFTINKKKMKKFIFGIVSVLFLMTAVTLKFASKNRKGISGLLKDKETKEVDLATHKKKCWVVSKAIFEKIKQGAKVVSDIPTIPENSQIVSVVLDHDLNCRFMAYAPETNEIRSFYILYDGLTPSRFSEDEVYSEYHKVNEHKKVWFYLESKAKDNV